MAEVIWAEPALNDLDAIADYIALDNPDAARRLVQKIFEPCSAHHFFNDSWRVANVRLALRFSSMTSL